MSKRALSSLLVALATLVWSTSAHAAFTSIGINFTRGNGETSLLAADVAGVPDVAQANWNNSDGGTTGDTSTNATDIQGGVIKYSDGTTVTGMNVAWTANTTFSIPGAPANPDEKLMDGYIDNTGTGGASDTSVTLTGIPYTHYLLYVYFGSDGNDRTGRIEVNGIEYTFNTHTAAATFNGPADYLRTTDIFDGSNDFPDANYAVFGILTTSTEMVTHIRGSNNSGIFGVQIVQVPEPATLSLLGLGGLVLLGRRRGCAA